MSLLPLISPYFGGFKYELQEYTGNSLSVTGKSLAVKPDGSRLLTINNRLVRIFDMSTPNDLSTASPNGFISLPSSTTEGDTVSTDLVSLRISDDGLRLFVLDQTSELIFAFTLSTAWGGSPTYLAKAETSASVTGGGTYKATQFCLADSGSRVIGVGTLGVDRVFSHRDMSIAFDITTLGDWSGVEKAYTFTADDISGFRLANNDTQLIYTDAVNDRIRKSALATAADMSTAFLDANLGPGSVELGDVTTDGGTNATDVAYGTEGRTLYVMAGDRVLEYRTIG